MTHRSTRHHPGHQHPSMTTDPDRLDMTLNTPADLDPLAAELNGLTHSLTRSRQSLQAALLIAAGCVVRTGDVLARAQRVVPAGTFRPWLASAAPTLPFEDARRLVAIAQRYHADRPGTVRAALRIQRGHATPTRMRTLLGKKKKRVTQSPTIPE